MRFRTIQRRFALTQFDSHAYCARGQAYACGDESDQAIADYTEAIRLDPTNPEPYFNRADEYGDAGETAKADADLAKAKSLGYRRRSARI